VEQCCAPAKCLMNCRSGMYLEVTSLPQQQQTEGVIQLGVGEQHGAHRRIPDPAWVQGREGLDLSTNVG